MTKHYIHTLGAGAAALAVGLVICLIASFFMPDYLDTKSAQALLQKVRAGYALGVLSAPVTVIEYASMTCRGCARFDREVLPALRYRYVDTGKVRFVLREIAMDRAARQSGALALCVREDNYFAFVDLLLQNQARWTEGDIRGNLAELGRIAGLPEERVDRCVADPVLRHVLDKATAEARDAYGVDDTPLFVVAGKIYRGDIDWRTARDMIDPLLSGRKP